jgi:hypothetical protein
VLYSSPDHLRTETHDPNEPVLASVENTNTIIGSNGGLLNMATSGGGKYSPRQHDDFLLWMDAWMKVVETI